MKNYTLLFFLITFSSFAQVERSSELFKVLKAKDSLIFNASFNTCNLKRLAELVTDDLEFYHDKSGLMVGKDKFIENTKNGLCKSSYKLRRELEKGTLEVFSLKDNKNNLYAAIQKGVHSFYENNKKGSTAKFTHLWVLKDEKWQLKRVLSYDHKQPKVKIDTKQITVSENILKNYAGEYNAPNTGKVIVASKDNFLDIKAGEMQMNIFPKSETLFFSKQQPLSFEFVKNSKGKIVKMIVLENGKAVEEAIKIK